MISQILNSKKTIYILMTVLVFLWGMEYIAAKAALEVIKPLALVCIKYCVGLVCLLVVKMILDRRFPLNVKDLPTLFVCALVGEILYFGSEYAAMSYLPISVITIILGFVPCVSILIEAVWYKNRPTLGILLGVLASVIGVALVIGADFGELFRGRYIGYLLAFAAVISWNFYNFITKDLSEKYKPLDLTILQQTCAIILVLPYTLTHLPSAEVITPQVITGVLYLGIVSAFIGFLIYIKAIGVIGPTPCALFSNFLPVTSTFFGWLLLNEQVSVVQLIGGGIVIAAGAFVIREKGKELDRVIKLDGERK